MDIRNILEVEWAVMYMYIYMYMQVYSIIISEMAYHGSQNSLPQAALEIYPLWASMSPWTLCL